MSRPVVLITGGAAGIGLAIARRMVTRGAVVWLWDQEEKPLAAAAAKFGDMARSFTVDIADGEAVNMAEAALATLPPTHLVNNAGVLGRNMALDAMDAVEIDRALSVNVKGTLLVTAAFLRARAAHTQAAIVNVASIAGFNGGAPGHAVYGATKGAILALTSAMARDLAPGVRVNALAPGIIDTDIQKDVFADRAALAAQASGVPLQRIGVPDEVAEAAEWLLFGAGYVTGETIRVGGGRK
ncbi:short-chain dehydrogenase of unknown substrate specificity [Rhizobium leguminosarum bv. trifolii WSM2297]|uniref:Ketoreductase domain-containing protein n=1 Tax=Rhizobium leguminosarum bv. trifolii WSM2297 TaxID=754762 RepID=J0W7B1_RHILT|nr:SDR family oxidoreductase [Rhizobium leguminosarum]EJC81068.1 short-chain dehydrogenase of unknown substrate specificity [Rhizobium leguminosarum bv. trifolii WSM2297]